MAYNLFDMAGLTPLTSFPQNQTASISNSPAFTYTPGGTTPGLIGSGTISSPTGQVLGAGTNNNPPAPPPAPPAPPAPTGLDPHVNPSTGLWDDNYFASKQKGGGIDSGAITGAINSGYDAYFNQLNDIMNSNLPQQQQTLMGGAETEYQRGVSSIGTQRDLQQQGLTAQKGVVEGQQKKTLADISNNLRNAYMAGNIYLGARGAGDSSAANQYSYALTKLGSQQRGDVSGQYAGIQNDIMGRENALATTYTGQIKDLEFQKSQRVQEVSQ